MMSKVESSENAKLTNKTADWLRVRSLFVPVEHTLRTLVRVCLAERVGFEPTTLLRVRDFQSRALDQLCDLSLYSGEIITVANSYANEI